MDEWAQNLAGGIVLGAASIAILEYLCGREPDWRGMAYALGFTAMVACALRAIDLWRLS